LTSDALAAVIKTVLSIYHKATFRRKIPFLGVWRAGMRLPGRRFAGIPSTFMLSRDLLDLGTIRNPLFGSQHFWV
jgi:hypothetical protein